MQGTDAVHMHMTNSRLTNPEVLEWRFPVLVDALSIRKNSESRGKYRCGDGAIRRIKFLQKMTAKLLSNRRIIPPYGQNGGEPGAVGKTYVEHPDGSTDCLAAHAQAQVNPADVFVKETPGGGGFGQCS